MSSPPLILEGNNLFVETMAGPFGSWTQEVGQEIKKMMIAGARAEEGRGSTMIERARGAAKIEEVAMGTEGIIAEGTD